MKLSEFNGVRLRELKSTLRLPMNRIVNEILEKYFNQQSKDGQKVKKTHWFRVTAFQRLAEIVGEYCTKGSKVGIRGQLQQRTWQDSEGVNHSLVKIRAQELELLGGKNGNPATPEDETPAAADDDNIPF